MLQYAYMNLVNKHLRYLINFQFVCMLFYVVGIVRDLGR